MKLVRFLLSPALAMLIGATAQAQYGYGPMGGPTGGPMGGPMGGPYGVMPASYAQPTPAPPMNGGAPMPMPGGPMPMPADPMQGGPTPGGAMQPAPVFADEFQGDMGGMNGDAVMEEYYGDGRGFRLFGSRGQFRQRSSRGYFTADAVMWHRNDATAKNINIQSPVPPAVAPANPNIRPFIRSFDPDFGFETLPRLTAGYVFMNDLALEATAFYKDDFDAVYSSYAPSGTLYATFFGVQPGVAGQGPPNSNWSNANIQQLRLATGVHSYEVNVVETSRVFNFIAGLRYLEVRDKASIFTFDGQSPGAIKTDNATIGTYNHLFGSQLGMRTGGYWRLFGMEAQAKVGYFYNDGQSRVEISNQGPGTGGARNSPRFGGQNGACVSEMRMTFTYRPRPAVNLRMGYECMFITNVALAVDQIDDTPSAAINKTGTFFNDKGDLFFHGPFAGAEFRF